MNIEYTSLAGSGKEIIHRVMRASCSQLLLPPRYQDQQPETGEPSLSSEKKQIGLFSSGTTGRPKCIWNSYEKLWQNGIYTADAFNIKPYHQLLMLAAPWHVAGFTWMLMAEYLDCDYHFITTKKGDYRLWWKAIQDLQPDYILTIPAVLRALYDENWFVPNVVFGGYPIEHHEYELLSPHCSIMYQGYGQTEAGGLISAHKRKSTLIPEEDEHLCGGSPIQGVALRCSGTKREPAPVFIESQTAFRDEEYHSGDLGYMDTENRVYITGRVENS